MSTKGISDAVRQEVEQIVERFNRHALRKSAIRYDAEEWLFPGSQHIDGTVEGAMRAGLEAYPL